MQKTNIISLNNSYLSKTLNKETSFPYLGIVFVLSGALLSLYFKSIFLLFLITICSIFIPGKELLFLFLYFFSRFNGFGIGGVDEFSSINILKGITINLGDFAFILFVYSLIKSRDKVENKPPFLLRTIYIFIFFNILNILFLSLTPIIEIKLGYTLRLFSSFIFPFFLFKYLVDYNKFKNYILLIVFTMFISFIFQILTIIGANLSETFNLINYHSQKILYFNTAIERFRNPLIVFSGSIFFYFLSKLIYNKNNIIELIFIIVFILTILIGLVRRPLVWAGLGLLFLSFYPRIIDKKKKIFSLYILVGLALLILSYLDVFGFGLDIFFDRTMSIIYSVIDNSDTFGIRNIENKNLLSFFSYSFGEKLFGSLFTKDYAELINANLLDGDVGILEVLVMYGILPTLIYSFLLIYTIYYALKVIKTISKDELKLLAFSISTFIFIFIPFHYNLNNFGYSASGVLILTNNLGLLASIKNIASGKHIEQKN